MKSLNPQYGGDAFHDMLARLAGVDEGTCLMDVGCGAGRTLAAAARLGAWTVGIDNDTHALLTGRRNLAKTVNDNRTTLLAVNVDATSLPFSEGHFDSVICQNVLECLADPGGLLLDCLRVLRPGGTLLLGHHDFGGVMLNSHEPALTRRIVAAYADEMQPWMATADGEMGRKLPSLARKLATPDLETETRMLVDLDYSVDSDAGRYCAAAAAAAVRAGVSEASAEHWMQDLATLGMQGKFYFAIPWIYVRAVK